MRRPPSYHTGFAPRDFVPRYPSLWKDCVGAWCPSLGPTGATLRDWAGRNHAVLATQAMISDGWVISPTGKGGGVIGLLSSTANSDSIVVGDHDAFSFGAVTFSVSCWINFSVITGYRAVISKDAMVNGEWEVRLGDTALRATLLIRQSSGADCVRVTANTFGDLSANTWYFLYAYHDANTNVGGIAVNGVLDTASTTGTPFAGTSALTFGCTPNFSGRIDGLLDDIRIYRSLSDPSLLYSHGSGRAIAYEGRPRTQATKGRGAAMGGSVFYSPVISAA